MIHKCEASASVGMDPDSPLNRSHQMERQAERMLLCGRYEQATACYNKAAENLQVAIQQTQNPSAMLSLRLQLENLKKQPLIITKRQQWGKRQQDSVLTVWNGRFLNSDTPDGLKEADPVCDHVTGGGGMERQEEGRVRMDSAESRFNSSEETDSLLTMIRQHHVVEDEQPRYQVSQLLAALKTLSLGNGHPEPLLAADQSTTGRKAPKTERTVVEELFTQNKELQSHLMQLFQVLDSCERENQKLKETVVDLNRQLEECRAHRAVHEDQFGMATDSRLEAPFSLIDGFACTPPTESLPPLSPLHIPNFEQVEDMS